MKYFAKDSASTKQWQGREELVSQYGNTEIRVTKDGITLSVR